MDFTVPCLPFSLCFLVAVMTSLISSDKCYCFYPAFPMAVHEHLLRTSDDFVWQVDAMSHGRFTIDVEFLDLRMANNNASIEPHLFFKKKIFTSLAKRFHDLGDSCNIL
jgi:hypothetical protein